MTQLIPFAGFFTFALIFLSGRNLTYGGSIAGILINTISLVKLTQLYFLNFESEYIFTGWIPSGNRSIDFGLLFDRTSIMMGIVVLIVSTLVQIYSIGYQHGKERFSTYFAYLNLFTSSMLLITFANSFIVMFIGWELVGLCSYLLIGFEYKRDAANKAAIKAFITTKFADLFFIAGLLLLYINAGTFELKRIFEFHTYNMDRGTLNIICLLLFIGAMGKSAQFPLHIWLPDAMEGPTPVSALIHAATMVAAGVYMVFRCYPLFEASEVIPVITEIGAVTVLISALIALTQNDIKKILAYSTISQLGFMFMGAGSPESSFYHLITHAFFKAGLFLAAGAIIHTLHTNDIFAMGGLSKVMVGTTITTFIFYVSITGLFPLSGFWSKETIIESLSNKMLYIAVAGSLLTTLYMTRMFYYTFGGLPRNRDLHAKLHEAPSIMLYPMWILAVLSSVSGFALKDNFHFHIKNIGGVAIIQAVIILVIYIYLKYIKSDIKNIVYIKLHALYRVLYNRIYIDDIFLFFIKVFEKTTKIAAVFDDALDRFFVDIWGGFVRVFSGFIRFVDDSVIDRIVDLWGKITYISGSILRKIQSGMVQLYILIIVTVFFAFLAGR